MQPYYPAIARADQRGDEGAAKLLTRRHLRITSHGSRITLHENNVVLLLVVRGLDLERDRLADRVRRHRERLRAKMGPANLVRARALRQAIIAALGGKCLHCGFEDWRALQVDHVNGFGRKDRARFANKSAFLLAIISNRDQYQLLCANCNWIKRYEQNEYRWKAM